MRKDPTEFRQRFNAYKNGKSVKEIYNWDLPKYGDGKTDSYAHTVKFLKQHEGFKDSAYVDGNGVATIGYGFTDSSLVRKGKISRVAADARLRQEVVSRDRFLSKLKNWDKLNEGSKTALRSYYYNYPAGFKDTTKFMKAWNAGDYDEAIKQVNAGMNDRKNSGLRTRRLAEQALLKADPFLNSKSSASQFTDDGKQQKVEQWSDNWKERLRPSARSKVLQKWNATGEKPQPESAQQYTLRRAKETAWKKPSGRKMLEMLPSAVDFIPGSGDVKQALDAAASGIRGNYAEAGLLGAGLVLPAAISKFVKPIQRYITGSDIKKRIIDAARTLDFSKRWDDDTSMRFLLNGEHTPDFSFVWHGRGTNRGQAVDVLRNYSDKDVGLHITQDRDVARSFAKDNGVVYSGIDTTQYPDAIYPDIETWDARSWESYLYPSKGKSRQDILDSMDDPYISRAGKKTLEKELAIRDIADANNLDIGDINNYSRRLLFAGTNSADREYANLLYADYLKNKGVNIRYKNDYEGGGFSKPSSLITDKSNVWWSAQKQYNPNNQYAQGILDWKTGNILPIRFPEYCNGKIPFKK